MLLLVEFLVTRLKDDHLETTSPVFSYCTGMQLHYCRLEPHTLRDLQNTCSRTGDLRNKKNIKIKLSACYVPAGFIFLTKKFKNFLLHQNYKKHTTNNLTVKNKNKKTSKQTKLPGTILPPAATTKA